MSADEIIKRREAVKKQALKRGLSQEVAEEIAQDAALCFIEKPYAKNFTNHQAFVKERREGIDRIYSRSGKFIRPILESEFEKDGDLVPIFDYIEGKEKIIEDRTDIPKILRAITKLRQNEMLVALLELAFGWKPNEIASGLGLSFNTVSSIRAVVGTKIKLAIDEGKLLKPARTEHGTLTMYSYYKCRCHKCRYKYSSHMKKYRSKVKALGLSYKKPGKKLRQIAGHGTQYFYKKKKCRCEKCRRANANGALRTRLRNRARHDEENSNLRALQTRDKNSTDGDTNLRGVRETV